MRFIYSIPLVLSLFVLFSCSEPKATEGRITYELEYPEAKDNSVLYQILPREMELTFKDGKMRTLIKRANFQNAMLIDCNKKSVQTYYKYAKDESKVNLSKKELEAMKVLPNVYTVELKDEEKEILGLTAFKAIATNKNDPKDVIEIWYTNDIALENSNWFHPFHDVPGVLLEYSMDRYGIKMEFKAKKIDKIKITEQDLELPKTGKTVAYSEYNSKLDNLFKPFE